MIRRAWAKVTRTWREAAAIIAEEQAAHAPAPPQPPTRAVPGQNPAPGNGPPPQGRGAPVPRPSPAPALPAPPPSPPGHPDRRLRKRIDVLRCGCTYIYDATDTEWNVITCGPTLDEEIRELLETAADACPGCGTPPGTWCPQWCEYAKDTE